MGKSLQMRKKHLAGSGGGAKSRTPIEAADSIQTISFARFMDILSEGPCVGFADGLKSYFCDETPIENADASRNFKNVLVDVRLGELDQDYVEGLTAAENEIAVGVEVKTTQPWTRNISNTTLDSVRVRLGWPGGLKKIQDNQDTTATIVEYAIDLAVDGGPFVEVFRSLVNEKASSQFERSHRVGLPAATIGWLLRVRRITPDSTSQLVTDKMAVNGFTEIIEAKLTYPGTAYVVTQIDGSQFQSVPQRAFDWIGRIVRVPSNYNAVTRTYTGIWDGTFTLAYTNNPAWCAFDLVTHQRYGLGKRVDPSVIEQDKWTFYEIARYCDEMVPDGIGGLEPRFTMNILLQDRAEAYRVLSDMFGSFNSMLFWGAGGVRISQDKPAPVDYVYTRANVSPEGFQYTGTSRTARHNAVLVAWNDQSDMSRQKVEYVEDAADIAKHGLNQIEIQAFGCTSRGQAIRKARSQLLNDLMLDDAVSFTVGLDKLKCVPGSIIEISDPKRMGQRMGGRIASATDTVITIDRMPPQAPVAGDILTCILPSGKPQKRTIDAVSGRSLSVSVPFDAAPLAEAVWQLERATLVAQQYRVMSITPKDDSKATGGMKFEISAVKHEPSKYAAIDYGRDLDPLPTFSKYVPHPPEGLSTSSRVIVEHGSSQTVVTLSWDPVAGAAKYVVEYRFNGGNWVRVENVVGSSYDIYGAPPGDIEWRIQAMSAAAQPSPPILPVRGSIPENATPPVAVAEAQADATQALADAADAMAHSAQEAIDRAQAVAAEAFDRAQAIAAEASQRTQEITAKASELIGDYTQKFTAERNLTIANVQAEATARGGAIAQAKTDVLTELESVEQASIQRDNQIAAGLGNQFNPVLRWEFAIDAEGWKDGYGNTPLVANSYLHVDPTTANEYVYSPPIVFDAILNRSVAARIKNVGNPVWRGQIYTQDLANPIAWIPEPTFDANGTTVAEWNDIPWSNPVTSILLALQWSESSDIYNFYAIDWVAIGSPTPAAGVSYVRSVEQASISRDQAEALARQQLATQFNSDLATTNASIDTLRQTTSDANSARAAEISQLNSDVATERGRVTGALTRIGTVEGVADAANNKAISNSGLIEALHSRVENTETQQSTHSGAISALQTRAEQIEGVNTSQAEKLQGLEASNQSLQNDINTRATKTQLETVKSDLNTVTGEVSTLSGTVAQHTASIESVDGKATNTANALQETQATVSDQGGVIASHTSDLTALNATVFDPVYGVTAMGNSIDETRIDIRTLQSPMANGITDPYFQTSAWVNATAHGAPSEGYWGRGLRLPASAGFKWWEYEVPVIAGRGYTLSGDIYRSNLDGLGFLNVEYLDANKNHVAWGLSFGSSVAGKWDRVSLYEVVPAGATIKRIYCETKDTTGSTYFNKPANKEGHDSTFSDDSAVRASLSRIQSLDYELFNPDGSSKKASVSTVQQISDQMGDIEASLVNKVTVGDQTAAIALVASAKQAGIEFIGNEFKFSSGGTGAKTYINKADFMGVAVDYPDGSPAIRIGVRQ